ncbi:MAG: ferrous iron transport protein B [Magnetococcales bacterium]|nr:ferrous iron transport protein B [Magnetococcales bacterium]
MKTNNKPPQHTASQKASIESSNSELVDNKRVITVGLVGNPNCGKTSLFNKLSDSQGSIGNYPRVTVEIQEGKIEYKGVVIRIVDLPGIYSLTSTSPEERIGRDYLHSEEADVLLNILDAGNLDRSLFFTTQLLEMGQATVYVLNMIDEAKKKGINIDINDLSTMLNGPVVETNAKLGEGMDDILEAIIKLADKPHEEIHPTILPYDSHLEDAINKVQDLIIKLHPGQMDKHQSRWLSIKLLEGDDELLRREGEHSHLIELVRRARYDLSHSHGETCDSMFADTRYGFIHGLLLEVRTIDEKPDKRMQLTRRIDQVILHRLLGLPIFIGLMWMMFESTFTLGAYPADWIDQGVRALSAGAGDLMPPGLVRDLLMDGMIMGIGAVVVFLPYILILFFFIAMFSETGYLARTSFLLDRIMHIFGLHGKAFIPLVMGFGCNVPAVMATRTIESPRARLVAVLINPFMSCSQRLPAFILLSGAFFPENAGQMIFIMYMISIATAMGSAVFLSKLVIKGGNESFVMELPPYRLPTLGSIITHIGTRAYDFVRMVGGVIVVGSITIWFLQQFPRDITYSVNYESAIVQAQTIPDENKSQLAVADLKDQKEQERMGKSYLGIIGQSIAPLFSVQGFDWKDSVAIISGIFAKEVVVASYGVLYGQDDGSETGSAGLRNAISQSMTPITAFALMVFLLLYSPCLSTIAAIKREAGWSWAGFSVIFSLTLAWTLSALIVSLGGLFF